MKKIFIFIISATIIGILLSLGFYLKIKNEVNIKAVSIFQTGVYSTYEEALNSCDSKTKIFYDGKLYHVYDSIVSSKDAKNKMIEFYKQNNIEYFVKEKYVNTNIFNDIDKYSKLIEMSDNEALKIINKTVIDKFGGDMV